MHRFSGAVRRWAGVLAVLALVAGPTTSVAAAAPADTITVAGDTGDTLVGLRLLGAGDALSLPGLESETGLTIAVPDGLTPRAIIGAVSVPASSRGVVDVRQDGRLLSRTTLPAAVPADLLLPLPGLRVDRQRRSADVVISTRLQSDGLCTDDPDDGVRLTEPQVRYSGTETRPAAVGAFLPPVLGALTITVPDDVNAAEAQAAVGLATAVAARYGSAPVDIRLRTAPRTALRPERSGPLTRQLLISTALPAGLHLRTDDGVDYLAVGGTDTELAAQAGFLTSDLSPLASTPGVIAGQLRDAPQLPRDVQTLADLGVPDQRVTAAGRPRLTIGIDQTRLARPAHAVRVQLHGTYTPPSEAAGRIVATVGERVVGSWAADAGGTFDEWVQIPDDLLSRYTALTVTAEYGGTRAQCGQADLATLTLDSSGQVEAAPVDPPVPAGLQSMPQALMPRVQLGWSRGDAADVRRAVSIMSHLQQLSAVRLGVDVGPVDDAAQSPHPAVLIAADGKNLPRNLTLPVSADGNRLTVIGGGAGRADRTLTLSPGTRYGALQAARAGDRSVLVASSAGDAADLDGLLDWLTADPDRWSGLSGDAVVKAPGQEPVSVTAAPEASAERSHTGLYVGVAVAVGLGLLVGAGLLVWMLRRRRRQS
ncbi:MAG: hypothetical protein WBA05_16660 [Gordonia sp. (in: high G+C Gram-positive bacteria)]|uniref:hypothetical protein n=1 Tax=Gordonia sp. (in: high G+C Gram-positive bacteria) TaxID=84139 RepID=UPI003C73DC80